MEDNTEGLNLPSFSGRISEDWQLHESNLKAWLFVRGIPLHSEESARILSLSLKDSAAIAYQNNISDLAPERTRFDLSVAWCRRLWNDPVRKGLKKSTAINEMRSRKFRQRGKRNESVRSLIDDLERLFYRIGVQADLDKRMFLTQATLEFPELFARISRTHSYQAAVQEAVHWEFVSVVQEKQLAIQRQRIADQRLQTPQFAPNPMNPTNSSIPLPHPAASTTFGFNTQQAAQPGVAPTPVSNPWPRTATSQPMAAPVSSVATSPSDSSHSYNEEEEEKGEEEKEKEEVLDSTSFEAVAEHEETRDAQQEVTTGSTSLPFAAPTPSPHPLIAASNLSRVDTLSPTHSTPIHQHLARPLHSRPALPSFDSPKHPSFSPQHIRPIAHQRSQSFDSHQQRRVSTPSFVASATRPLFAFQPIRVSSDHYQPPRPSTSQSLYSRAPLPPTSPSLIQRSRSVLRKPSRSQHSRSFSQPLSFDTTTTSTISRSSSLLDTLFRRNRKPKLDGSSISRPSMCLTPDSTNEYNTTGNWSRDGQVGGRGQGSVPFEKSFVGGEGEELFEERGSAGRAPKQRGNGVNGLPP